MSEKCKTCRLKGEIEKRRKAARKVARYARERKAVADWQKTSIDVWRLSYEEATRKKCELQRRLNDLGYQKQIEPMLNAAIEERDEWKTKCRELQSESAKRKAADLEPTGTQRGKAIAPVEVLATTALTPRDGDYTLIGDVKDRLLQTFPDATETDVYNAIKQAEALGMVEVRSGIYLCITCKSRSLPGGGVEYYADNIVWPGGTLAPSVTGLGEVKCKLLRDNAKLPERKSAGASGYDVFAAIGDTLFVGPRTRRLVPLGVALEVPRGYECQIRARSGLAYDYGLTILNGVGTIDSDYRGELKALVINHGTYTTRIEPGQAVAQLVFAPVEAPELVEVNELSATERGDGGFGSTDEVKQ